MAKTSTYVTLSITGFGLIVIPISSGTVCVLTLINKVSSEIIINVINTKNIERAQQTNNASDKLHRELRMSTRQYNW